jgi:hypothetical protein
MAALVATDRCFALLHAAGWSVGEAGFATRGGCVWQVNLTNGGHTVLAWAETQTAAWRLAAEQAEAIPAVRRKDHR